MKQRVAERMAEALGDQGRHDHINLRDSYSGRCMYGKTTWAISGDFSTGDIAAAAYEIGRDDDDDEFCPDDFYFSEDSMGLGIVIY